MIDEFHFDYIIIGNGLAGLQLALKMTSDSFFDNKQIALIDVSEKKTNDKTWSFWETKPSQWNDLTYKTWEHATVITSKKNIDLNLKPYQYKSIKSIDFYRHSISKLKKHSNIHFIKEKVYSVNESKQALVKTNKNTYTCNHVFDSRIPNISSGQIKNYTYLIQHFKGWVIKTNTAVFDNNKITMMDYRLKDGEQTTFTYILPFSKNEALIEFTYFTENTVTEAIYDTYIKTYIDTYLKIENYTVIETEMGQIPMTNFPFYKYNTKKTTKIGTAGGWVKGSTGYSFKHTEKKAAIIIGNLKANRIPSHNLFKSKYMFYDKVFLKVLKDENYKGEWIFQQFYDKNSIQTMFRFLDEESSFIEEIKIMWSLFSWSFIKAFFKTL
ncbi:lycopene cyclase [Pseudalgibacter alginicilyticus]|uniref:Lycopene cyclase n=1 Tax=Pseudalgibacter alginicilyticus TaxID=1736674 RepID=A0A0P0D6Q0_9FLAO|nr:lycopene cyclase family protein [Pseudalgibacter alginicilyticus]ALJ04378.1 lycopene cyclase [Pseudalgibacter alginicilyticus]